MREFTTFAVAATVFSVMLASAPAQAEHLNGAPAKNGNQCFKYTQGPTFPQGGSRDERFGAWVACPQTASAPAAPAPSRRQNTTSR
jgi:hypothetical protein